MTVDVAVVLWPVLMVVSALVPVVFGIREYRRSR